MSRAKVIVATTSPVMAHALAHFLENPCLHLGLNLEICPGSQLSKSSELSSPAYSSAEELFDYLDSINPTILLDTLIILDTGAYILDAFKASISGNQTSSQWHQTKSRSAGIAVELLLRFPQLFPVFLSSSVPINSNLDSDEVMFTENLSPDTENEWGSFKILQNTLKNSIDPVIFNNLYALQYPLHFVSPMDQGRGLYSTLIRFSRGMRSIFDPTGLRTLVKLYFLREIFKTDTENNDNNKEAAERLECTLNPLKLRLKNIAIAIDEEREFAFLNSYTAYKYGRRSWMVTTFDEFDNKPLWVLPKGKTDSADTNIENVYPFDVVILRDIDMRFPDIPESRQYCDDSKRESLAIREQLTDVYSDIWQYYNYKKQFINRIGKNWKIRCVSSSPGVLSKIDQNTNQYGQIHGERIYWGRSKPISTIYDLTLLLNDSENNKSIASRIESVSDKSKGGHGAPYLNLSIAEALLIYSAQCKDGPVSSLLSALLASEAYELLLGMSGSTALEALRAMHKGEVSAEVSFVGVAHDLNIEPRINDINHSLTTLCKEDAIINKETTSSKISHIFLSQFWAELRIIYKNGEQFSAAEQANLESLAYMSWSKLRISQGEGLTKLKLLILRIASSFKYWSGASLILVVIMAVFYGAFFSQFELSWNGLFNFFRIIHQVIISSLQVNPSPGFYPIDDTLKGSPDLGIYAISLIHFILSYILLGMFISMLFRKITRS